MVDATTPNASSARLERIAAGLILAAAAVPRIWAAWSDQGLIWPNELVQTLEQAHRFAFGFGQRPWEFREGARSWVFPGALGMWMKVLAATGFTSAPAVVRGAKLAMAGLSLVGVAGAMVLARSIGGAPALILAGALAGFFPSQLMCGSRAMGEMASGPLVVWAAALLIQGGKRRSSLAGMLAATAIFVGYWNLVLFVGLLLFLLVGRRGQGMLPFMVASAITILVLGGVLDWVTWGKPFSSFYEYVRLDLFEGKASSWGRASAAYYFQVLWASTGPAIVLIGLGFLLSFRKAPWLGVVTLLFLGVHIAIPHREFRFIMPVIPLAMASAAIGLAMVLKALPASTWSASALSLILIGLGIQRARTMTFGEMGQWLGENRQNGSAWHRSEEVNRLLWEVSAHDDLCGVMVVGSLGHGDYSYLHRDVPLLSGAGPVEIREANYIVAPLQVHAPGFEKIIAEGAFALYRREGTCVPMPKEYSRDLPGP